MTNTVNPVSEVVVIVSDLANGIGGNVQVTVPVGTALSAILKEVGVTVKEGQRVNFLGKEATEDTVVNQGGLASVTANTKAA